LYPMHELRGVSQLTKKKQKNKTKTQKLFLHDQFTLKKIEKNHKKYTNRVAH